MEAETVEIVILILIVPVFLLEIVCICLTTCSGIQNVAQEEHTGLGTATVLDTEVDTVVIALLIVIDHVFLPNCLHLPDSLFRYPKCRIGAGYGSGRGARYESGHGSQCPFNLMVPQVLKFFLACICLTPCSTIQNVQKVTEECAADLFCAHLSSVCENNDESLDSDVTADHQRHVMCVGKGQRPMVIPQRFPHHSGADLGDNYISGLSDNSALQREFDDRFMSNGPGVNNNHSPSILRPFTGRFDTNLKQDY